MVRRFLLVCALLLALVSAGPPGYGTAHASQAHESSVCGDPSNAASFQSSSGATQVTVCPSLVVAGHTVRMLVRAGHSLLPVRVQIQYPDGTVAPFGPRLTDAQGVALFTIPVRYNPINRYAEAPFTVLVGRNGRIDTVSGTIQIAQGVPLSTTRLRAHPADQGGAPGWCPGDPAACVVHNGWQIVARVDTDPSAQVVVTLSYPDGQSVPCTSADGANFADAHGIYECEVPVAFQPKGNRGRAILSLVAQVSSGSYAKTLPPLKLYLVQS